VIPQDTNSTAATTNAINDINVCLWGFSWGLSIYHNMPAPRLHAANAISEFNGCFWDFHD
jgi:hypothetical protein